MTEVETLRKAIDKIISDDCSKSTASIKAVMHFELRSLQDKYPDKYFIWNGRFIEFFEDEDSALSF